MNFYLKIKRHQYPILFCSSSEGCLYGVDYWWSAFGVTSYGNCHSWLCHLCADFLFFFLNCVLLLEALMDRLRRLCWKTDLCYPFLQFCWEHILTLIKPRPTILLFLPGSFYCWGLSDRGVSEVRKVRSLPWRLWVRLSWSLWELETWDVHMAFENTFHKLV